MTRQASSRWPPAVAASLLALTAVVLASCEGRSPVSPRSEGERSVGAHGGQERNFIEFDAPGSATASSPACGGLCGTFAYANNAKGAITGSYTDNNGILHGFLRTTDGHIISFDAPGGLLTQSYGINDLGVIVGSFENPLNVPHGYVRYRDGSFTTFDAPGVGTGAFGGTVAGNINREGTIAGDYVDATGAGHGFVRSPDGNFRSFDPPGSINTALCLSTCLNLKGELAGTYFDANGGHGFLREPDGKITTFDVPGAAFFAGSASINAEGAIAGLFADSKGVIHAFVRTHGGNFTKFDAPGAAGAGTVPASINSHGAVTGSFFDATNVAHGFVRSRDSSFATFDAPGAGTQAFQGTYPADNQEEAIVGWLTDGSNVNHGFVWTPAK